VRRHHGAESGARGAFGKAFAVAFAPPRNHTLNRSLSLSLSLSLSETRCSAKVKSDIRPATLPATFATMSLHSGEPLRSHHWEGALTFRTPIDLGTLPVLLRCRDRFDDRSVK